MAGRFLNLFKIFRRKKRTSPEAAPGKQLDKTEQFQPLQKALEASTVWQEGKHFLGEAGEVAALDSIFKSSPCLLQVPAILRNIHQRLVSHITVDARLQSDIVRLAEEHPADVVLTLLRCAPTCDRAAAMIWRTIGSSGPAVEKVLATLLCVMADWPLSRMFTSDGDNEEVFALAVSVWNWPLLAPRFAVQAMKALLCRLRCDNEVMSMDRKRGWDMLLCAHTQHFAVGLLARRMCCLSPSLLDLLDDADGEVISMTLSVFMNVLLHKDILVSSTNAPKLAEALLLLFNHDNSHVQVLSIQLFCKVIELVVDEGKKLLKAFVNESLYPLSFYCHDVNWHVAEASRETLLRVAEFLKRRDLEQLLKKKPP
ncbi:uncharacterized protein LOC115948936 [Geospiza fortis]|uniref:Uncharacterized protein LOC115948936 n=1 Tax=Geospiza fortis TaxID=48883 RepID=A0A8N5F1S7_GEOFO|nr:uncharacterized protein LOC115948936 [Geospiza fortis]